MTSLDFPTLGHHYFSRETLGYEVEVVPSHDGVTVPVEAIRAGCDLLLICKEAARVAEAREALTREAERDEAFRRRLNDAAERARARRRQLLPRGAMSEAALLERFASPEAAAIRDQSP